MNNDVCVASMHKYLPKEFNNVICLYVVGIIHPP